MALSLIFLHITPRPSSLLAFILLFILSCFDFSHVALATSPSQAVAASSSDSSGDSASSSTTRDRGSESEVLSKWNFICPGPSFDGKHVPLTDSDGEVVKFLFNTFTPHPEHVCEATEDQYVSRLSSLFLSLFPSMPYLTRIFYPPYTRRTGGYIQSLASEAQPSTNRSTP
ncbi:MAG: hypothetical protein M1824_000221 [Vezdaea acicularis]|nr:MAG: hypothetical protein M1824_000221 [Vezdaea acicularis]